jgi:hypothetical protein
VIDKTMASRRDAVVPVFDGAGITFGGFSDVGMRRA